MSPQLRHLRTFVAVAEERSFTRAAERLHVAQQAVSATVRLLELELGVTLLIRSTRKVELTPSGEALLEHGRAALESFATAWSSAREAWGTPVTLSVAYDPILGQRFVERAHNALIENLPCVHVSWRPRYNADLARDVLNGRFDAGIAIVPELLEGIEYEPLAQQPLKLITGERHRLSRRSVIDPCDLERETVFVLPRDLGPRFYDEIARIQQADGGPRCLVDTPDPGGSLTLDLYARGKAVGLSTAWVVEEFVQRHPSTVVHVAFGAAVPRVPVMMVWRRDADHSGLERFLAVCREMVSQAA